KRTARWVGWPGSSESALGRRPPSAAKRSRRVRPPQKEQQDRRRQSRLTAAVRSRASGCRCGRCRSERKDGKGLRVIQTKSLCDPDPFSLPPLEAAERRRKTPTPQSLSGRRGPPAQRVGES